MRFTYVDQPKPDGIAQAFILGEKFIGDDDVCLILGDNIFYGHSIEKLLNSAHQKKNGATIFAYRVKDPERYGVVSFDDSEHVVTHLEEKPNKPRSNYAVTGLYFYDKRVVRLASQLKPSARGELEITDLNRLYLELGELHVEKLGRGYAWLDTGTKEALLQAATFVESVEQRQGLKICCPEEIAYRMGFINEDALQTLGDAQSQSEYGQYLLSLVEQGPVI